MSTLFEVCVPKVFAAQLVRELFVRAPDDVVEQFFGPLRSPDHPRHVEMRMLLAQMPQAFVTLPLRGRVEAHGTSPVRSVLALANCDELVLWNFRVDELRNATFANLTHLRLFFCASVNIDAIIAPALVSIVVVLEATKSEKDATVLSTFMQTKNARRCTHLALRIVSGLPVHFHQLPVQRRKSRVQSLRMDVSCTRGLELDFLSSVWSTTIHTLVVRLSDLLEDVDIGVFFASVCTLGLLSRPYSFWSPDRVARICLLYFPGVENVAAGCTHSSLNDALPSHLARVRGLFFGDGHPLNRGDPALASLVDQ